MWINAGLFIISKSWRRTRKYWYKQAQTEVFLSVSPLTRARVHMQEKVDTSRFILCKLAENSTMLSIHSPKPRRHWSRCHTEPSQKISFPSSGLDLKQYDSLLEVDINGLVTLLRTRLVQRICLVFRPIHRQTCLHAMARPLTLHRLN